MIYGSREWVEQMRTMANDIEPGIYDPSPWYNADWELETPEEIQAALAEESDELGCPVG